jgi:hypothetical protein
MIIHGSFAGPVSRAELETRAVAEKKSLKKEMVDRESHTNVRKIGNDSQDRLAA